MFFVHEPFWINFGTKYLIVKACIWSLWLFT